MSLSVDMMAAGSRGAEIYATTLRGVSQGRFSDLNRVVEGARERANLAPVPGPKPGGDGALG